MENASDALIMAFGFMIFVLALSISISLFGQARRTSEYIFDLIDRENEYIYENNPVLNRKVSVETIIPTMYRAYKENFKIVFLYEGGAPFTIYTSIVDGNNVEINTIDLEADSSRNEVWVGTQTKIVEFLNSLISGQNINGAFIPEYSTGLYNKLKNVSKITEYLGEYYQEDLKPSDGTEEELEVNKTKKRIITYVIQN